MSSGVVNPIDNPRVWDVLRVAGQDTPGRVEITGADRPYKWMVGTGFGANGAVTVFTGVQPAKPKARFYLWLPEHFVAWERIRPLFKYDPGKGKPVVAVDVYHPALADNDIKSLVVETMGGIEHQGGGMYTLEISFIEYRPVPPEAAVGKPSQSVSDDPVDPQVAIRQGTIAGLVPAFQAAYAP